MDFLLILIVLFAVFYLISLRLHPFRAALPATAPGGTAGRSSRTRTAGAAAAVAAAARTA